MNNGAWKNSPTRGWAWTPSSSRPAAWPNPVALARLIRFSGVERIRPGGVIDVIDALTHFDTVDRDGTHARALWRGIADADRGQQTRPESPRHQP